MRNQVVSKHLSRLYHHLSYRNIKKKASSIIILVGKKGNGKSFLALAMSCRLDPTFRTRAIRWVFTIEEFNNFLKTNPQRGSCIVFDELGVAANCRDAQKKANKHLSYIAQTIRPYGITVFGTVPTWRLFDSQVRNQVDFKILVDGFDTETGLTAFKMFQVIPSQTKDEPMTPHLIFDEKVDGFWKPVKRVEWFEDRPPMELAEEYEAARFAYSRSLAEHGLDEEEDTKKPTADIEAVSDQVYANKEKYKAVRGFNFYLVQKDFNLTDHDARRVRQCLQGRGIKWGN